MSKKHFALFFNATPGWLLSPLPNKFDAVGTQAYVKSEFRDYIDDVGRFENTDNLIADVWVGEGFVINDGLPDPDYRLSVGPRGGIVKERF